jgi:hypothetical protein
MRFAFGFRQNVSFDFTKRNGNSRVFFQTFNSFRNPFLKIKMNLNHDSES